MGLTQEQGQKQVQTMTPQMIQSAKILQMDIQELREYVNQELLENPVLETVSMPEETPAFDRETTLTWQISDDEHNTVYHRKEYAGEERDPLSNLGLSMNEDVMLDRCLLSQFEGMKLEEELFQAIRILIEHLTPRGFLEESLTDLVSISGLPLKTIKRALIELQSAYPAGIGAKNIQECLCLQVERRAGDHRLALTIIQEHLEDLARGNYKKIAAVQGVDEQIVRRECALIQQLNLYPANGFARDEKVVYIVPDISVRRREQGFEIQVNRTALPELRMNDYYTTLLNTTADDEVKTYLKERVEQAKTVIRGVSRRSQTLSMCVEYLLKFQADFFCHGPNYLAPLAMETMAKDLGLHISTVSRALKDKYLQCDWGTFPLSYFLPRSLKGRDVSVDCVKDKIRRIIEEERRPLSDQKIAEALTRQGIEISRRTVAKYREEMGIPPTYLRKSG